MIPLVNPARARQSSAYQPWLSGAVRWIVVVLALVATADAAYLSWTSIRHGVVAGCNGTEHGGCDDVLTSGWSRVVGLPVALGGVLCYGTILGLSLAAGTREFDDNPALGTALVTAALLAALAGMWFTALQFFQLRAFCYYCLGIHGSGLVIAGLVTWSALRGRPQPKTLAASRSYAAMPVVTGTRRGAASRRVDSPSLLLAAPIALLLIGIMIGVQVLFPAKTLEASKPDLAAAIDMTAAADTTERPEELSPDAQPHVVNRPTDEEATDEPSAAIPKLDSTASDENAGSASSAKADDGSNDKADKAPKLSREVSFLKGKVRLDTYQEAVLGSPDAKYVVAELMDYTCPHCRKMQAHLREARDRYGDQLAIVILPVPLELECNKMVSATDPLHRGSCKISRTALAVAKVEPNRFVDFHNFLLADEEKAPTPSQSLFRAFRLVDRKELSKLSGNKEIDERIQRNIRLFAALEAQHQGDKPYGLPVQLVGDTVLTGDATSEELFEAWEKALGIKPL